MRKVAVAFAVGYVLYVFFMALYLFVWANEPIPDPFVGTAADPATFMTPRQLELAEEYSRIQYFLSFVVIPLKWGIYLFVLIFGFSRWLREQSENMSRIFVVRSALYTFFLLVLVHAVTFPVHLIHYQVALEYGISTQSFSGWMKDYFISFWIGYILTFLTLTVIYVLIRQTKRWWLYAWLLSIPFTIFLMYIQPVWIDPLYHDFYELPDNALKQQILQMAEKAGVPAEDVFAVKMSEETNALNAYVNGIGDHLRIVLWDTTLKQLSHQEILFVMAHEIGHYVMNHLILSAAGSIVLSGVGLFLAAVLFRKMVFRYGEKWGVRSKSDLASIPALLLLFSLLSFVALPVENAVSRHYEHEADAFAIKMTENKKAAISAFQEMTVIGLSEVDPPALVKFFFYGHPTMLERLVFIQQYGVEEKEKNHLHKESE